MEIEDSEADKSFHADYDPKSHQHGVFGDVSGHLYSLHRTFGDASRTADEMNKRPIAATMQEMIDRVDGAVKWPTKSVRIVWYVTLAFVLAIGAIGYYFVSNCTQLIGCK